MTNEAKPGTPEPAKSPDELVKPDTGAPLSVTELDQVAGGVAQDLAGDPFSKLKLK